MRTPIDPLIGQNETKRDRDPITRVVCAAFVLLTLSCGIGGLTAANAQPSGRSLSGAFPDCGLPPVATEGVAPSSQPAAAAGKWSCIPPYQTPPFTPPADDSVALASLLEASGVTWMNGNDSLVAAGRFCDMTPKQLAIFMNPSRQDVSEFAVVDGWFVPRHFIALHSPAASELFRAAWRYGSPVQQPLIAHLWVARRFA